MFQFQMFMGFDSEFRDIFDVDHFITSLRGEVRILRELPTKFKKRLASKKTRSMPPISWSDISYYHNQVHPFSKTPQLTLQFYLMNRVYFGRV